MVWDLALWDGNGVWVYVFLFGFGSGTILGKGCWDSELGMRIVKRRNLGRRDNIGIMF